MCLYVSAINDTSYYVQIHCNTHWFFHWNSAILNGCIQYSYILMAICCWILYTLLYWSTTTRQYDNKSVCQYINKTACQYVIGKMVILYCKSKHYRFNTFFVFYIHPNNLQLFISVCLRATICTNMHIYPTNIPKRILSLSSYSSFGQLRHRKTMLWESK